MPRSKKGAARRQQKSRWLKQTKGYQGARGRPWGRTKESVLRAGAYAYRDRRTRKREFRKLWITRISAACKERGIRYNELIAGLKAAGIRLNRKMLSEIAIADPAGFDAIVAHARSAHQNKQAA